MADWFREFAELGTSADRAVWLGRARELERLAAEREAAAEATALASG